MSMVPCRQTMRSRGVLILLAVMAVATLLLCFRPERELIDRPLVEDAYYSFSVARNIALGNGITIDGVQPTNGFQPLFTFLCVLPQWLAQGDRVSAVRFTLLLSWAIFLGAALLFAAIMKRLSKGGTAFAAGGAAYLGSMYLLWHHFSGLETGLLLFMYLACWWWFIRSEFRRTRDALIMGVLLGLLVLTRIDAAFFAAALALVLLCARQLPGAGFPSAAIVSLAGAALSAPWWLYCYHQFGSFMPSSGASQQLLGLSLHKLSGALHGLAVCAMPSVYLFGESTVGKSMVYLALFALVCVQFGRAVRADAFGWQRPGPSREAWQRSRYLLGAIIISVLALMVWYASTSGSVYFYRRYFVPFSLLAVTLTALAVDSLSRETRLGKAALLLVSAPSLGLSALLVFGGKRLPGNGFLEQVEVVQRHVPAGDIVGGFQSGTLGYFRDRVVNLDGKVNPRALQNRARMAEYVDSAGILWLCDWPWVLDVFYPARDQHGFKEVARGSAVVLYGREPK